MASVDIFYWADVALALYAAYLVCFCLYKVDRYGNKTDERIYVPRIVYLLALGISFVPILNGICALLVIGIAIVAYYISEDWYFKSWLLERPGDKKRNN